MPIFVSVSPASVPQGRTSKPSAEAAFCCFFFSKAGHSRFRGAPRKSLRREEVGPLPLAAVSHCLGFLISRYFGMTCLCVILLLSYFCFICLVSSIERSLCASHSRHKKPYRSACSLCRGETRGAGYPCAGCALLPVPWWFGSSSSMWWQERLGTPLLSLLAAPQ